MPSFPQLQIAFVLAKTALTLKISSHSHTFPLMGANFSSFFTDPNAYSFFYTSSPSPHSFPTLGDLPGDCVALVLTHLDPPEICKLAKLNRAFRGASWFDFVWDSKLPINHEDLVERVLVGGKDKDGDGLVRKLGKREIFVRLCKANTFDGGTKKAWLDKITGGVCISIAAKGLAITGIDDRRYWNRISTEESGFSSVAYLQQIWWFEVDGQLEFPFPAGTYSLFFRIQLGLTARRFGRRICNTEHVHGWNIKPVQFQLWTSDGQHASSQCFLNDSGKWDLYYAGDFVVDSHHPLTKIKFSMTQIDCTHTKGGLCLDSVLVYPCKYGERLKHF